MIVRLLALALAPPQDQSHDPAYIRSKLEISMMCAGAVGSGTLRFVPGENTPDLRFEGVAETALFENGYITSGIEKKSDAGKVFEIGVTGLSHGKVARLRFDIPFERQAQFELNMYLQVESQTEQRLNCLAFANAPRPKK